MVSGVTAPNEPAILLSLRPNGSRHRHQEQAGRKIGSEPRVRVLVVDDDAAAADSLGLLLDYWGFEARVVYDAETAMATVPIYRPRIVLMDISLPRADGYELAKRLREEPGAQDLVLVALTGHSDDAHRCRSAQAGLDYYLVKPVDPDELQQLLASLRPTTEENG